MKWFVNEGSIVREIWGKADTILFIFAGASAEFALNKSVDWLYFTGKLPADPLGRLFRQSVMRGKLCSLNMTMPCGPFIRSPRSTKAWSAAAMPAFPTAPTAMCFSCSLIIQFGHSNCSKESSQPQKRKSYSPSSVRWERVWAYLAYPRTCVRGSVCVRSICKRT